MKNNINNNDIKIKKGDVVVGVPARPISKKKR